MPWYRAARWLVRWAVLRLAKRLGVPTDTATLCVVATCSLEERSFEDLVAKWRDPQHKQLSTGEEKLSKTPTE